MSGELGLADVLRQLMHEKGWGQERLAQASGVSKKTIHNWLKPTGVRKPHTWQPLIKVAGTLGLSKSEVALLLQAARQPTLDRLLAQAQDDADRALLQPWSRATPHNLPQHVTSFVGRAAEIAAVSALLDQSRLVLLTGPGGSGKTRLALAVAQRLVERFDDGVWFVDLAPLSDSRLVLSAIAQTLGLPEVAHTPLQESIRHYLRQRQALLVLDNFEQVLDAAPAISMLLAAAPALTVLVTSRVVLRLSGEHEFVVPPLPLPDLAAIAPDALIEQYPSVALFVQRAQAVAPAFRLTPENAPAIVELCIRLDGLPLAIELAAARIKVLSPQALLARLVGSSGQQALHLLQAGTRDLPPRHRALHATIDWSYALLAPPEQRLFARLAVFVNGWTLELAETICADPSEPPLDVLSGVTALLDSSLLVRVESADDQARFGMLATIREYAAEQLARAGTTELFRRRHAVAYVAFVERAYPYLCGLEQHIWLRRLRAEHDNLRAALAWMLSTGALELALRLAVGLWEFWAVQGHIGEGRRWLAQILAHDCSAHPRLCATLLRGAGKLAYLQGDYAQARALYDQALAQQQTLDQPDGIARVLNDLGVLAREQGDYAHAYALHQQSLSLSRAHNDLRSVVHTLFYLGQNALHAGDHEQAQRFFAEGIALDQEPNDLMGLAITTGNLAGVAYLQQDYAEAARLWEQSLRCCEEVADTLSVARTLCHLAGAALHQDQIAVAQQRYLTSLHLCRELADKRGVVANLAGLGAVASRQGDRALAARLGNAAAALRDALGIALPAESRQLLEETLRSENQERVPSGQTKNQGTMLMQGSDPALLLEDLLAEVDD